MTKGSDINFTTYKTVKLAGGVMKIEPSGAIHKSSYLSTIEPVGSNENATVQDETNDSNPVVQHSIIENAVNSYLDDDDNDSQDSLFDVHSDKRSDR